MPTIMPTICAPVQAEKTAVVFENPGEIDAAAIATFGVSVKEGDNPIGFFGTGLKYAIAILLRTGHKITIWSGLARHDFGIESATIRGEKFDLVTMDGERLGFTTQVGKTWELWMAYRELYCNARDECGEAYIGIPSPAAGRTFIVVSGRDFVAVHADRDQYFLEDSADLTVEAVEIRRRPSVAYFYRGVRVMPFGRRALFTYNDLSALTLTEDRTVRNQYEPPFRIARAILRINDEAMVREIVTAPEGAFEHDLDFDGWSTEPSPAFLAVVGRLVNSGFTDINRTARKVWEKKQSKTFAPALVALTDVQRKALARATEFCVRIGFPVAEYPIKVVRSLGTDTLGLAHDGTIFVAERTFHLGGSKQIAVTLIEEFVHLRHGYQDCERPMQNFLFERMVSLGEELVGEPL